MKIAVAVLPVALATCFGAEDPYDDDDDAAPLFDPVLAAELEATLQDRFGEHDPLGIVAAVQMPDGTRWIGAVGDADLDGTALAGDEAFKVASVSKTFVAALVLEAGLDLDGTIEEHIDHPRAGEITVRMLLNHSAGVPEFSTTPAFQNAGLVEWTDDELLGLVVDAPLQFEPGSGYAYSNTHYVMLSMIVEATAGSPWQGELQTELADRLGLVGTYAPDGTDGWGDVVRGELSGQDLTDSIRPSGIGGAGNVVSTACDLGAWARGLWGGFLLGDETTALLAEDPMPLGPGIGYGLGTLVLEDDTGLQLAHNGALNGYVSWVGYRPEQDVGLAVLANSWLPGNPPNVAYSADIADALWADVLEQSE